MAEEKPHRESENVYFAVTEILHDRDQSTQVQTHIEI